MSPPAEQIARFVTAHPGEWREEPRARASDVTFVLEVYPYRITVEAFGGAVWGSFEHFDHCDTPSLDPCPQDADLLTQIAWRGADALQAHGGTCDTLPAWLADPVRRHLRTRAGELLTLAGFSPADVVSAAETLDEALCGRPVIEVTGVLRALMAIGMSCRWATGADEAADDYVGFVSKRLGVVAGERDALAAKLAQVQAMQAAQEEYVTARMIAARSVLRGVADEPRASQVTALDAADAYLVDALYRKPKPSETAP